MKQRSGQRAFSESEVGNKTQAIVNTIVPGVSVTSMSSTGSYTDNPGYHTLRTIHNRHKPILDFIETGDEHEIHLNGGSNFNSEHNHNFHHHHHHHHNHHQNLKRSDSITKQRHPSGSGKRRSVNSNNKKKLIMLPLKEEDLAKSINDRYWGITLPGKLDHLLTDEYSNLLDESIYQVHTPTSPGVFEYHTEETCLKCHNFMDENHSNRGM